MNAAPTPVYDAAIVGLGPVGQLLALLLAKRGHRVVVAERQAKPYPLPRAVHVDPDVIRVLDEVGITDGLESFAEPARVYEWQNAARETLLQFAFAPRGRQGWAESYMFHQPTLEELLRRVGQSMSDRIAIFRGTEAVGVRVGDDEVELELRDLTTEGVTTTVRARYLIGCDGAKSFVRGALGAEFEDLGVTSRWVVIDAIGELGDAAGPDNLQVCDPARPWTHVSGGPGRRRYEFMLMPGDDAESIGEPVSVAALLDAVGAGIEADDIERTAVYTFVAGYATTWRRGRLLLAGDAAHRMPPFYGQGLVSGVRDAANLAWKLDLVLRGDAEEALLDTYESERLHHVQHAIGMSVELGRVICEVDPERVAARDAHFLATGPDPRAALPAPPPELPGPGVFADGEPREGTDEGTFAPQGLVRNADGAERLLDRIADGDFTLLVDGERIDDAWLVERHHQTPAGLRMRAVRLLPEPAELRGPLANADLEGHLLPWLREAGRLAVIVRPDFVVYGSASTPDELEALVTGLGARLRLRPPRTPHS